MQYWQWKFPDIQTNKAAMVKDYIMMDAQW